MEGGSTIRTHQLWRLNILQTRLASKRIIMLVLIIVTLGHRVLRPLVRILGQDMVIDLGTSRKVHMSAAIETMAALVSASEQARVITLLMFRVDVLADIEKKLKAVLPKWYHVLLMAQGNSAQTTNHQY